MSKKLERLDPIADPVGASVYGVKSGLDGRLVVGVQNGLAELDADGKVPTARVGFVQAGDGSVARTLQDKAREVVSVKDKGAVGDGVADDWPAFLAAWTYCRTAGRALYIPSGTYNLSAATTYLEPYDGCVVYGDGMEVSKIVWNKTVAQNLFYRPPSLPRLNSVEFRDFWVHGGHGDAGNYTQASCYPFLLYRCDVATFARVKVTNSRVMGIVTRDCASVHVDGCVVRYCARDGINTADCNYVIVSNNRVEYCDDDAIAHHSSTSNNTDRGWVVTGNIVRFCQGIKGLGVQSATITGNLIEFPMSQGIDVSTSASGASEGRTAASGVTITGNTIKNVVDRTMVDSLNTGAAYIKVSSASAQAGGLAAIPGRNDTATGTVISPYPYFGNSNSGIDTTPIPDSINILISGNSFVRDIPTGAAISALGYGSYYTRTGPNDPTVTASGIVRDGIHVVGGTVRNVLVEGNIFSGLSYALEVSSSATVLNWHFTANTVFDCAGALALSGTNQHRLLITNNIIDLDPFLQHANRGTNGTWLADGSPTAILIQTSGGVALGGNVFRNCCRISDQSVTTVATLQGNKIQFLSPNHIDCEPAAIGFSASNRGIGNLPRGTEWIARIVDSNPSSATYGQILNHCPQSASAIPTAGTFIHGHYVRNNNPAVAGSAASQYIVQGWMRMTTGSAHVLNTDWREMRTLTGT